MPLVCQHAKYRITTWTGSHFDANSYLNNLTATPLPFNNNNEYAASIGGPIKKNKLFFFLDTEGIRYIVPSTQTVFAPTTSFANATLANIAATNPAELPLYTKAFNLYEHAPGYSSGTPIARGGCGAGVTSGLGIPCFQSWTGNPSEPATEWLLAGRIDYNMTDRDHLFWQVDADHGTQATGADPINSAFNAFSYQPQYNGQGQWTHVLGANATNQFVYAGSYYRAIFEQQDAPATFPTQLDMSALGYTSLGGPGFGEFVFPQGRNVTQYQFIDDFSLTKGAHNLRFGANFRRYDITDYAFSTEVNPLSVISSVDGLYDGVAAAFSQSFPDRQSYPVALWGLGVYAQDEWQAAKGLKLTFALRAEHDAPPVCQLNCASLLTGPFGSVSTSPTTPYNSMILSGLNSTFRGVDTIDWSPRFGFAWSPHGSDNTVVRGGFGLFYDAFPAVLGDSFMTNLPTVVPITLAPFNGVPWADQVTPGISPWQIASSSAGAIRSGFPAGASYASLSSTVPGFAAPNFASNPNSFHLPRYQEWNVQVEQQLDSKSSMTLAYIGNHGVNEPITNFPNAALGVAGIPAAPFNSNFGAVTEIYSGAVSNDNQLTASYQRRLTYGFNVTASYTWAHAFDEISNGGVLPYSSTSAEFQLNPYCLRCNNYGPADYDIRNSFNAQFVWITPWKFSNSFVNGAFGGWTLSENFFVRSGLPFTVFDGTTAVGNYNPAGNPYIPAQVVGAGQGTCNIYLTGCLNPAGFTAVSALTAFPNQARNQYRGPGFFDSDVSVSKNFKLTERVAFGIGANAYNVFNHSNFANPVNFLGASTFGQVTLQAVPPSGPFGSFFAGAPSNRILQFQGKITF